MVVRENWGTFMLVKGGLRGVMVLLSKNINNLSPESLTAP